MKFLKLFVFIVSIWVFSSCSLPKSVLVTDDLKNDLNNFQRIIQVDEKSKDELYLNANDWFVSNFTKSDEVIEFRDKEAGKISGKYIWRTDGIRGQRFSNRNVRYDALIKSTIFVDIKDEKVRVKLENPLVRGVKFPDNPYKEIKRKETAKKVLDNWDNVVADLEQALKRGNDENW